MEVCNEHKHTARQKKSFHNHSVIHMNAQHTLSMQTVASTKLNTNPPTPWMCHNLPLYHSHAYECYTQMQQNSAALEFYMTCTF